ncbi:MAG: hypothetical protein E6K53_12580 [Gammaproteobacteria bacterium]|nr:MAG: hypothetical protein E6K53_12580 [Gammaproteobacteria bacterium]
MQLLRKIFASGPALMMASTAFATNVLPLAEISTQTSDAYAPQFTMLDVAGLPAMPKAALQATRLESAHKTQVHVDWNGQGTFAIDEPEYSFWENKPRADFLMVELPPNFGYPAAISISDGSGTTLCNTKTNGKEGAVCVADIRPVPQASRYFVGIESNADTYLSVNWAGLVLGAGRRDGIVVTGPGHADACLRRRTHKLCRCRPRRPVRATLPRYCSMTMARSDRQMRASCRSRGHRLMRTLT